MSSEFWDNVAKMFKEEGREEAFVSAIVGMLKAGIDIDSICTVTEKPVDYVLSVKKSNNL